MFKQLFKNIEDAYYNLSSKAEMKAVRELRVAIDKEFSELNPYVGTDSLTYISKKALGARVEFRFEGVTSDIIIEANIDYDRKSQVIRLVDKSIFEVMKEASSQYEAQKEKDAFKIN